MSEEAEQMARILANSDIDPLDDSAAILVLTNARFKSREIMQNLLAAQLEAQVMKITRAWS